MREQWLWRGDDDNDIDGAAIADNSDVAQDGDGNVTFAIIFTLLSSRQIDADG